MNRLVVIVDTEWGYRGDKVGHESAWVAVVFCALVLLSGQELAFLPGRDDNSLRAFLAEHRESLFVSHSAPAEMKYLLRLGLPVPKHWHDTLVAERWLTNQPVRPKVGLASALERRNLGHFVWTDKSEFRDKILNLDFEPDDPRFMAEVAEYCLQDCRGCGALFSAQVSAPGERAKLERLMSWYPRYQLAVSRMELRGIPIDIATYQLVSEHWPQTREMFASEINDITPIMTPSGLDRRKTTQWFKSMGLPLPTIFDKNDRKRRHSISDEALKGVEHHHPFIAKMRQVQRTLKAFRNNRLVVDSVTGRHYSDIRPFATVTGRNAPTQFIFNMPKWYRFLIVPESPEHALVYVDYTAQEIGIAAALSHDPAMIAMYQADDPHMYFARLAGAVPDEAGKEENAAIRKKYKTVNLGVLYGQAAGGTAERLGISYQEAEKLHREHHRLFPAFWTWSERMVTTAINRGSIRTRLGWRALVPPESNSRTWANWPMQANGADIMRLTAMYMDEAGLEVLAPVHDGFLISCRMDELAAIRRKVDYSCASAVEHVLGDFKLKWTVSVHKDRFVDPDGLPLWETVQGFLQGAGHDRTA